ncbi:SAM-dependent methyltransferase [Myxococcota bacterium]|nr:SAM-dependent methyltransferase [Myxococcota bacterium]
MDPGHRARLTPQLAPHFPGDTLFDRLARAVCAAGVLPRKELYEAWQVARRVRRRVRGGRVVDLACGHGLLAHVMLLLDDSSPTALGVDRRIPKSAARLAQALEDAWPRLAGRVTFVEEELESITLEPGDVVVSAHACGALTDVVLARAIAARAAVAVLPCCHDVKGAPRTGLEGWLDGALAMDVARATRLVEAGYDVHTESIPAEITPKNRLLLARPR